MNSPKKLRKIGMLTGGGDCPGLNAVIRAVTKTAINDYDVEVIGFKDGYFGLVNNEYQTLSYEDVSGILTLGGTILGTSNIANPFRFPVDSRGKVVFRDLSDRAVENIKANGLDVLIVIGGDGSLNIAYQLSRKGVNIIGIPKPIDNDVWGTDRTFGFDSAVATATEAIDKLHTTAQSHHRVMLIEVMGRYAGWLALHAGVAGGGDVILIPEIPYEIDRVYKVVEERNKRGRRFSIIVVSEGARPKGGRYTVKKVVEKSTDKIRLGGVAGKLAIEIEKKTGLEARATILGHLQRGGSPTAFDRILATKFGNHAVRLAKKGSFQCMVALRSEDVVRVSLKTAISKLKLVNRNNPLIKSARSVGTSFGD